MSLDRDAILQADDLPRTRVDVQEWGGSVNVRVMTGAERDAFEAQVAGGGHVNLDNIRARLVALTLVDDDGKRLFSDTDVTQLGNKSAAALDRVFSVAQKVNGLTEQDVQELAGN